MKKVFVLTLAVVLLLGGAWGAAAQSVTLRFSAWGSPEQNAPISDAVNAFQAKYPNITVEQEFDPFDAYWDKKTTQSAGDQLPDVFAINNDNLCLYAGAGRLADLTPYLSNADIASALERVPTDNLHRLEINGHQLGFPFASGAELLYYNKTMFDAAGLDYPTPEWTLQNVLDAAAKLTKDTNGDGQPDQWGYYPNYLNEETYYAVIHRFGGRYISDDGKTALNNSPEAAAGLQFIQDLSYKYMVAPKPQDLEGIENAFAAGMIAMYEDGAYALSDIRSVQDFEWDVTSIPLGFEGQVGDNAVPGNPNFVVSSKTAYPEESALLAAFLAGPEAQTILGKAKGRMPVNPIGLAEWLNPPPEHIGQLTTIMSTPALIVEPACYPHGAEIEDVIRRSLDGDILTNSSTADAVMPGLAQEIQTLLDTP
jgi:multiple sugar transport system substrate-binding protein